MRESCLRWFGHVQRRVINALVRKSELIQMEGTKECRGSTTNNINRSDKKRTYQNFFLNDTSIKEVTFLLICLYSLQVQWLYYCKHIALFLSMKLLLPIKKELRK